MMLSCRVTRSTMMFLSSSITQPGSTSLAIAHLGNKCSKLPTRLISRRRSLPTICTTKLSISSRSPLVSSSLALSSCSAYIASRSRPMSRFFRRRKSSNESLSTSRLSSSERRLASDSLSPRPQSSSRKESLTLMNDLI